MRALKTLRPYNAAARANPSKYRMKLGKTRFREIQRPAFRLRAWGL
jgi:hypothetical protein